MKGAWFPGNSDHKQTWHGRNMESLKENLHTPIHHLSTIVVTACSSGSKWVFQLHTILVEFAFCSQDFLCSETEENSMRFLSKCHVRVNKEFSIENILFNSISQSGGDKWHFRKWSSVWQLLSKLRWKSRKKIFSPI